jgi:phage/plasmid-like protein (TIGR03299 family)
MSSEIIPGVDTMALAAKAWHGYGTVVGRNMTYAEALSTAGLDWTAAMAPLTAITASGVVEIDTHRATYRSDTGDVLGVVGADYQPHQPAELVELARLTLDAASDDGHVEVLGTLRGGRTVFVTIALPDDIDIAGDVHMPRLVWVTSMDGTIATRAVSTYVRAVCANTIRASFRQARTSWAARHTSKLEGRAADAREALRLMFRTAETFRAEVEALARQTITDHHVEQVLTGIWPDNPDATDRTRASAARRRDAVRSMYRTDNRVAGWHGTAYGLVQAASTWEQWAAPRRGDRGAQVLAGVFAGARSLGGDVAERVTALA